MNGRFKECEIEYHTETRKLPKSRGWRCWCCLAGSSLSLSPLLSSGLDYKYVMSVKTRVCLTEPIWTTETFLKHECDVGMGSGFSSLQDQLLISYPALNAGDKNTLIFSPKIKNKKIPKKFDKKGPILSFRNESNFTNLSLVKIFIQKKTKKKTKPFKFHFQWHISTISWAVLVLVLLPTVVTLCFSAVQGDRKGWQEG